MTKKVEFENNLAFYNSHGMIFLERENYIMVKKIKTEENNKHNNEKKSLNKYIIIGIIIIVILLVGVLSVFLWQKLKSLRSSYADDVKIYELTGESNNFYYADGLFINSDIQNILVNGNVKIKNDELTTNDIVDVEFRIDDEVIKKQSSFFRGMNKEYVGYNELFKKLDYSDSNFSLKITYMLNNKRETEELQLEKVRLLDKKDIPKDLDSISEDESPKNTTYYDESTKKALALEDKGFTWNGCCYLERTFDNGDTLTVRADGLKLYYVNKEHGYGVTSSVLGKSFSYYDDNYHFKYYTDTNEIKCDDKKKCPSDGYELIKDYLEFFNHLWD